MLSPCHNCVTSGLKYLRIQSHCWSHSKQSPVTVILLRNITLKIAEEKVFHKSSAVTYSLCDTTDYTNLYRNIKHIYVHLPHFQHSTKHWFSKKKASYFLFYDCWCASFLKVLWEVYQTSFRYHIEWHHYWHTNIPKYLADWSTTH